MMMEYLLSLKLGPHRTGPVAIDPCEYLSVNLFGWIPFCGPFYWTRDEGGDGACGHQREKSLCLIVPWGL